MRNPKGRLELTWMGKDMAIIPTEYGQYDYEWVERNDPRACEVKSIDIEMTVGEKDGPTGADANLFIIGDSGAALRSLRTVPEWAQKYLGQVKLVYIDPPFNTDQVFKHYADQLEHSIWLTMMRDRIRDLKPLLAPDASIWVHLDDAEVHRMRVLMDEEFGDKGFVATIVWQKRYSRESRPAIGSAHDTILIYALDPKLWKTVRNKIGRGESKEYKNPDNDPRGPWRLIPLNAPGTRKNQKYDIIGPDGTVHRPPKGRCWSTVESGYKELLAQDRIRFGMTGKGAPSILRYLDEAGGLTPWTWWPHTEVGHTDESKKEIQSLFPEESEVFDTPKPERLLQRIIHIATSENDLVLDCFGGSGTTAAVAHKMGRRWLTVELSDSIANRFLRPRLQRVVSGSDGIGISTGDDDGFADDSLDGVLGKDEAKATVKTLADLAAGGGLSDEEAAATATIIARLSPRKTSKTVRSGGGFTVARMGPSMYEVDDATGLVFLSDAAVNGSYSKAVAGHLKFQHTPDNPVFVGVKGRQRLAVVDGVVDENVVGTVVENLADGEKALIVGKAVLPEAEALLSQLSSGSRVKKTPTELFPRAVVK